MIMTTTFDADDHHVGYGHDVDDADDDDDDDVR